MNNQYRKYTVYDEYREATHTVIAHAFSVAFDGTLIFTKRNTDTVGAFTVGALEAVTAFASGYWSKVEFIETVEAVG